MKSYISHGEANELGNKIVLLYLKQIGKDPSKVSCVDVEGLIMDFLNLPIKYVNIAEPDPNKLGFLADGVTPLRVRNGTAVSSVVFPQNTIIVDSRLLSPKESGRRRFTLVHEGGHYILTKHNPVQVAAVFHREYDFEREYTPAEMQEMLSMNEMQANWMASSLIMPVFLMDRLLKTINSGHQIPVYGQMVFSPKDKQLLREMAESIGVSFTSLIYRLKELNMLEYHSCEEYILKNLKNCEAGNA